jgi:glycosyltransferase involved in cell wall biosynthesis
LPTCDVINLHWIAGFVDYMAFFRTVPQRTPVVWRLADMNAFTGGCHYDDACGKYRTSCGTCPQLASTRERDLAFQVWQRKKLAFDRVSSQRLHIVAPSRWTAREAGSSALLRGFPTTVIPNALDTAVFSPRDQQVAREALEVPRDAKVVLFVSDRVSNKRKGLALLVNALIGLRDLSGLFLVSLGRDEPDTPIPIPHLHFGFVDNDRLLSLVYSAADVYAIPSLQESFGQTVLESMACGTPVVGFDVGGIPDMVRPGITGLLAPRGDVDALSEAIARLVLDSSMRAELSANCRRIVVEEYALEVQARRYVALYEDMLAESRRLTSA